MKLHPLSSVRRTPRRRAGFSLAELMVVIVILGLLATVVVPKVVSYLGAAQSTLAKTDLVTISDAITTFRIRNANRLPDTLDQLIEKDSDGNRYLDMDELVDPWGNEYVYEPDFDGSGEFRVISYGKDGQPGGEGENTDIDNRMAKSRTGGNTNR